MSDAKRKPLNREVSLNRWCPTCAIDMEFAQYDGATVIEASRAQLMTCCPTCGFEWPLTIVLNPENQEKSV